MNNRTEFDSLCVVNPGDSQDTIKLKNALHGMLQVNVHATEEIDRLRVENKRLREALYLTHEHLKLIAPKSYCKNLNIYTAAEEALKDG